MYLAHVPLMRGYFSEVRGISVAIQRFSPLVGSLAASDIRLVS